MAEASTSSRKSGSKDSTKKVESTCKVAGSLSTDVCKVRLSHRIMFMDEKYKAEPFQTINSMKLVTLSSRISYSKLTPTVIRDLRYDNVALGKSLMVRTIESFIKIIGLLTVIEDTEGTICSLGLFNYFQEEFIPPGTVLLLKEPHYVKRGPLKVPIIKCDSPTNVIVLSPGHPYVHLSKNVEWKNELPQPPPVANALPAPTTAEEWTRRGRDSLNEKKYLEARDCFHSALQKSTTDHPLHKYLLLDIAKSLLRAEYNEKVIEVVDRQLKKNAPKAFGIFAKGNACYNLRQYEKAKTFFDQFSQLPNNKHVNEVWPLIEQAKKRLIEKEKGEYDMDVIRDLCEIKEFDKISCADYNGPIKIIDVGKNGRGVIVTKNVTKDTLLMASRRVCAVYFPDDPETHLLTREKNYDFEEFSNVLAAKVGLLIAKNPQTYGPIVYKLSAGKESVPPSITAKAQVFCETKNKNEAIVDTQLIRDICKCNYFKMEMGTQNNKKIIGLGLFDMPSYINHNCEPNAHTVFYGGLMFVYPTRKLYEGEEILISYVPNKLPYRERREEISKRGFVCLCDRCQLQRKR